MDDEQDIEFENLLAEKRHKEFMAGLEKLGKTISALKPNDNKEVIGLIQEQMKIIRDCLKEIKGLKQIELPEMPDVNVEFDQAKTINSIDKMEKSILAALEKVNKALTTKPAPKEFHFIVKRGKNQLIETIIAKQKT